MQNSTPKKTLGFFSLIMINVIAVDSLRSLPITAEWGLSLFFFYAVAAILFFIPSALASAELATAWPNTGGIYVWVKQAFGQKAGFIVIWLQWVYNVIWFPTITAFITATFAYVIDPSLTHSKLFMAAGTLIIFWAATLINWFGMRFSSWASTFGAILGTLLPMVLIIGLSILWMVNGHPTQINFQHDRWIPDLSSFKHLSFMVALVFGLIGLEMSGIHAGEVKDPRRDYPRALLISATIILLTLTFASFAIATVIPKDQLDIVTGLIQAFQSFFEAFGIAWMNKFIVAAIIVGSLTGVAAWIIGPAKGLMVASLDDQLPKVLCKTNKAGAPTNMLLMQGVVVSLLASLYLLMPTITSSYWLLTDLTAQLALLSYIGLFAALIKLRFSEQGKTDGYRIPGGKCGVVLVGSLGIFSCLGAMALGFVPPQEVGITNLFSYECLLMGGMLAFTLPAFFLPKIK